MRTRRSGFTLVELMVVLVIMSVLAAVALMSIRGRSRDDDMRNSLYQFISMVRESRRMAISLRQRTVFEFTRETFRWCVGSCLAAPTTTAPQSRVYRMHRVKVLRYARAPVLAGFPPGTFTNVNAGVTHRFYFEPDGTMIGATTDTLPQGITLYFQHDDDTTMRRRVPVMPLVGSTYIIPSW